MERFTGVKKELIDQIRLDFCEFYNENRSFMNVMFENQLAEFNSFNNLPPENFIGSHSYVQYKSRIYESLCDSYTKLRLVKYAQDGSKLISFGFKVDKLTTKPSVNRYRDRRMAELARCVVNQFSDEKCDTKYDYITKASCILEMHAGKRSVQEFKNKQELDEYFCRHKGLTFNQLEKESNDRHNMAEK